MKRSKFSLSNYKLFSCDMGELVPCGMFEVLPGDSIQHATQALVRASPLLAPVMHPVHVGIRHFFVPYRLLWDEWEDFITGGPDGMNASIFPTMTLTSDQHIVGELADYLGVPLSTSIPISALPFRAYALIYNEYFRDQDLQSELAIYKGGGNDGITSRYLAHANWEKDYFTSSRPWEQKGPSITIPLGDRAPISGLGTKAAGAPAAQTDVRETDDATPNSWTGYETGTAPLYYRTAGSGAGAFPDIFADLTGVSAVTINVLREAMALQRYEEARARFGSRYTEYLRYLGVQSSDARLQRPEYLGGGKQTIQFSEVLQTAEGENPVGELRGHGIAAMRSNRYRRFFEEHGVVMSLMTVRPKTMYMQSLSRMWNRRNKEDFWQKELQHIGQQEVLNKEVYAGHTTPDGVFGYQDRYDEYRRQENSVAGEFRTSELSYWHFARDFATAPALNSDFVKCVPTDRTFAIPSMDVIYTMAHHSIQARRLVAHTGNSFIF